MFFAWFWSSKIGRAILFMGGLISTVFMIYLKGRSDQKVKDKLKEAEVVEDARKVENEIDSLSSDDLRSRASRWVRD